MWRGWGQYVQARLQKFAFAFARRLAPGLTPQQIDYLCREVASSLQVVAAPVPMLPQHNLRLVLRHDCQSSGCGDGACVLCQYNPSRICKRNLKQKYLIDDHLRAKCNAGLRVEVVDETGQCVNEATPDVQLEIHVLNGEKYREVCPDNTLLNTMQLRSCVLAPQQKKPLLKREGGLNVTEDGRIIMVPERGHAPLSDLQCTTSSEALLAGKAPTFRLLVWAIDRAGNHLPSITYVVSESFVVATKRVKHAIKSDIPCVADHVSKLVHIGKATVDKLTDLRQAAREENLEIDLPDDLVRVERVGQFTQLVELTEASQELKHKVRHLLKLSPEKWDEVAQHCSQAVVPDFRPRIWWCPNVRGGLLFACRNGAIAIDQPIAYVGRGSAEADDSVIPIHQLDPVTFNLLPKLKQQALQEWYAPGHSGWAVYWRDASDPLAQQMAPPPAGAPPPQLPLAALGMPPPDMVMPRGALGLGTPTATAGDQQSAQQQQAQAQQQQQQQQAQQQAQQQQQLQYQQQLMQPPSQPYGSQQQQPPHQFGVAPVSPHSGLTGGGGAFSMQSAMPMSAGAAVAAALAQQPQQPAPSQQQQSAMAVHQQHAAMAAAGMSPTALQSMLSPTSAGAMKGPSPFASQGTQSSVPTDAFPAWAGGRSSGPGTPVSATAAAAQQQQQQQQQQSQQQQSTSGRPSTNGGGGPGPAGAPGRPPQPGLPPHPPPPPQQQQQPQAGGVGMMLPSLEMINTDDLPPIGANPSLFSLDSLQQMQMLGDLPSVGVGQLLAGGGAGAGVGGPSGAGARGGDAGGAGATGAGGGGIDADRALSLKFSMSLDLAEMTNGGSGGGGKGP
ncbi:hypothetical protein MNEG_11449 [Monoraphidium neglectum]|uniref:Uncharacterized protein n=1 Tax=Monoraphidium neglectum TaxID=145388 RepID=A0A0D2J9S8_9CHLO|nr:hypothetical protein MNEG_11449 [Monoraphidium neglectum]KIY96512.1 hypothetical protein MNEG_11449 [Monoraphidium neglectum]|eukprot:XP_013895532.1 hypothetical protein MNEG_11449 [Monoraphidium neglectum]